MKTIIDTQNAPAAVGAYSQATLCGTLLFVSGQLPIDPATGAFAGEDIASQTKQSLENICAILKEAGFSLADVVKSTVLLADISDFTAMNAVYSEYFKTDCPARAAFAVAGIPKGAKVEIEVIAAK